MHYLKLALCVSQSLNAMPTITTSATAAISFAAGAVTETTAFDNSNDLVDEARSGLATRIMSNGVEVIIANDKPVAAQQQQTEIDPFFDRVAVPGTSLALKANYKRIVSTGKNNHFMMTQKPLTLAPSTLKNQMILVMPTAGTGGNVVIGNTTTNYSAPFPELSAHQFITKTCLTTYTYRTTYLQQDGQTNVKSHEQIISNIATEEHNYLKMRTSLMLPMEVTLTETPDLAVGVFSTTYLYFNTIAGFATDAGVSAGSPLVFASEHTVVNTITAPEDYIAFLQPSEDATPVYDTNTYYSRIELTATTTLPQGAEDILVTTTTLTKILTQVIVTESQPARSTPFLATYFAYDVDEKNSSATETTGSLSPATIATTPNIPSVFDQSNLHIYATKTFMTTFTYFTTTLRSNGADSATKLLAQPTAVNYHTRVIENIITEDVPISLLDTELLAYFRTQLQQLDSSGEINTIVTMATLLSGQILEVTALQQHKPAYAAAAYSQHQVDGNSSCEICLPTASQAETYAITAATVTTSLDTLSTANAIDNLADAADYIHYKAPIDSDLAGSEQEPYYVSAPPLTTIAATRSTAKRKQPSQGTKVALDSTALKSVQLSATKSVWPAATVATVDHHKQQLPVAVNQLIGSFNFQRLTALQPVFSVMAGLIKSNLQQQYQQQQLAENVVGGGDSEESSAAAPAALPLVALESKHTLHNINSTNAPPIYIPVQNALGAADNQQHSNQYYPHLHQRYGHQPSSPPKSINVQPPTAEFALLAENNEHWLQPKETRQQPSYAYNPQLLPANEQLKQHSTADAHKLPVTLNGGIAIRPGELITANSDVIVGKPNGMQLPRLPTSIFEQQTIPMQEQSVQQSQLLRNDANKRHTTTSYKYSIQHPATATTSKQDYHRNKPTTPNVIPLLNQYNGDYMQQRRPPSQQHQHLQPLGSPQIYLDDTYRHRRPPLLINKQQNVPPGVSPNQHEMNSYLRPPPLPPLTTPYYTSDQQAPPLPAYHYQTIPSATSETGVSNAKIHHLNTELKYNEVIEIKRIPEIFSTDLPPIEQQQAPRISPMMETAMGTQLPASSLTLVIGSNLKKQQASALRQQQKMNGQYWQSAYGDVDHAHLPLINSNKNSNGNNAVEKQQPAAVRGGNTSSVQQQLQINLDTSVLSHMVDMNVPPLTFKTEDDDASEQQPNGPADIYIAGSQAILHGADKIALRPHDHIPLNQEYHQNIWNGFAGLAVSGNTVDSINSGSTQALQQLQPNAPAVHLRFEPPSNSDQYYYQIQGPMPMPRDHQQQLANLAAIGAFNQQQDFGPLLTPPSAIPTAAVATRKTTISQPYEQKTLTSTPAVPRGAPARPEQTKQNQQREQLQAYLNPNTAIAINDLHEPWPTKRTNVSSSANTLITVGTVVSKSTKTPLITPGGTRATTTSSKPLPFISMNSTFQTLSSEYNSAPKGVSPFKTPISSNAKDQQRLQTKQQVYIASGEPFRPHRAENNENQQSELLSETAAIKVKATKQTVVGTTSTPSTAQQNDEIFVSYETNHPHNYGEVRQDVVKQEVLAKERPPPAALTPPVASEATTEAVLGMQPPPLRPLSRVPTTTATSKTTTMKPYKTINLTTKKRQPILSPPPPPPVVSVLNSLQPSAVVPLKPLPTSVGYQHATYGSSQGSRWISPTTIAPMSTNVETNKTKSLGPEATTISFNTNDMEATPNIAATKLKTNDSTTRQKHHHYERERPSDVYRVQLESSEYKEWKKAASIATSTSAAPMIPAIQSIGGNKQRNYQKHFSSQPQLFSPNRATPEQTPLGELSRPPPLTKKIILPTKYITTIKYLTTTTTTILTEISSITLTPATVASVSVTGTALTTTTTVHREPLVTSIYRTRVVKETVTQTQTIKVIDTTTDFVTITPTATATVARSIISTATKVLTTTETTNLNEKPAQKQYNDSNNIFIVMTANSNNDNVAAINSSNSNSTAVSIDYDESITFEQSNDTAAIDFVTGETDDANYYIPTRDDEQQFNSVANSENHVHRVFISGVHIAPPPKLEQHDDSTSHKKQSQKNRPPLINDASVSTDGNSDKSDFDVESDACQPACKATRNEICRRLVNHSVTSSNQTYYSSWYCGCRPGFERIFPDRPCKPTFMYSLQLSARRIGNYRLYYVPQLQQNNSDDYKMLAGIALSAVDRLIMQSDLRDVYHNVKLLSFEPISKQPALQPQKLVDKGDHLDVMARFLLQLSDNSLEKRLENVLKKQLRLSNFSIGGTELYTNAEGVEAIQITDFDECLDTAYSDCSAQAHCFNLPGTYTCSCREGFLDYSPVAALYPGRHCSAELVGCAQCHYHGKCTQRILQQLEPRQKEQQKIITVCECFAWYLGASCQINMKILLIALVALGTILFILLLFCILLAYSKRCRQHKQQQRLLQQCLTPQPPLLQYGRNGKATHSLSSLSSTTAFDLAPGLGGQQTPHKYTASNGESRMGDGGRKYSTRFKLAVEAAGIRTNLGDKHKTGIERRISGGGFAGKSNKKLDKCAIMLGTDGGGDSSSEVSQASLPYTLTANVAPSAASTARVKEKSKYISQSQQKQNKSVLISAEEASAAQQGSTLAAANEPTIAAGIYDAANLAEQLFGIQYPEQTDRSLTLMIPRAKYHHLSVLAPTKHVTSMIQQLQHAKDGSNENKKTLLRKFRYNHNTADNAPIIATGTADNNINSYNGALVSAGFEVSAIVSENVLLQNPSVQSQPTAETTTSNSESAVDKTARGAVAPGEMLQLQLNANAEHKVNSIFKLDKGLIDTMDVWLDNVQQNELSAEARSFDETTVHAATKPLPIWFDAQTTTTHTLDETNAMAERDVGSTFLLPHTHLYKPDLHESDDFSGFDSF